MNKAEQAFLPKHKSTINFLNFAADFPTDYQKFLSSRMHRYFLHFSYDGGAYHGWQIQPNNMTVQELMTERMSRLFGPDFSLTGAGRTDAGVHASQMVAHFDVSQPIADVKAMLDKLNSLFPADISVSDLYEVRPDVHARFDAVSRRYQYHFCLKKNPYKRQYSARLYSCPDVEAMNQAAAALFDYIDFTSFSKLHSDVKTNNCRIMEAHWQVQDDELIFTIKADRFLRNMVRAIVGTMLEVGRHKISLDEFRRIIESKDRCAAGTSAPPQGLFLTEVEYPENIKI